MITTELLVACGELLSKKHNPLNFPGKLYFQSNVEDVAVYVKNLVETLRSKDQQSESCGQADNPIFKIPTSVAVALSLYCGCNSGAKIEPEQEATWVESSEKLSTLVEARRRRFWEANGGSAAVGAGWLPCSIFPHLGRTETEVVRELEGKSVHRIVFLCDHSG